MTESPRTRRQKLRVHSAALAALIITLSCSVVTSFVLESEGNVLSDESSAKLVSNQHHSTAHPPKPEHSEKPEHGNKPSKPPAHHDGSTTTSSTTTSSSTSTTPGTTILPSNSTNPPRLAEYSTPTAILLPSDDSNLISQKPQNNATHETFHHHHHQWGHKNHSDEHHHHNESCSEHEHGHSDKVEQILWDIFGDEDEDDDASLSDEDPTALLRDDGEPLDSFEEMFDSEDRTDKVDEEDHHSRQKRSTDDNGKSLVPGRNHKKSNNRPHSPQNQKRNHKTHSSSVRKTHSSKSKASSNVGKYNDYMDVVLKRMNSMIKTKKMDPLMVNLFSGGGGGGNKKHDDKKKKKKPSTKKKRKGAKNNRARMEMIDGAADDDDDDAELEEELEDEVGGLLSGIGGRREDEEEDDSELIELDNDHDTGGGQIFRRDVYVSGLHDVELGEDEEEDESESGSVGERGFREMRALIVNGSMKRSANETSNPPPTSTPPSDTVKDEKRGFSSSGKQTTTDSSSASSEEHEPPKKGGSKKTLNKKKPGGPKKKGQQKPTRGILKGLSSLRRSGNVDVVRQGDKVRIVRSKFLLGPVTLEIVPRSKGKGGSKGKKKSGKNGRKPKASDDDEDETPKPSPSSPKKPTTHKVTAVAQQLKGIIEVRLKKHAPTTIKRLRVFPPSSVKIKPASGKKPAKGAASSSSSSNRNIPRYGKVTPVATHRLRQIATAVVKQADVRRRGGGLSRKNVT